MAGPQGQVDVAAVGSVEGRGAAGVVEVGRPLDMVRERAGRQARRRAIEALVEAAGALATTGQGGHTGKVANEGIVARTRSAALGASATWQVRHWSNGAVSARVTVPAAEVVGP